eukprot:2044495-Amphidinium_carterae.1
MSDLCSHRFSVGRVVQLEKPNRERRLDWPLCGSRDHFNEDVCPRFFMMCLVRETRLKPWRFCQHSSSMQRMRRLRGYALYVVAWLFWRCFDSGEISSCSAFSLAQREQLLENEDMEDEKQGIFMGWPPSPATLRRDLVVILAFAVIAYIVSYQKQRFRAAPQIDKISPTLPSPMLGALCVAALYGTNIAYNVLNKRLLTTHTCPVLITTVNFGAWDSKSCPVAGGSNCLETNVREQRTKIQPQRTTHHIEKSEQTSAAKY